MSKRILITSCKGGVGKSTISANLAAAFCRMGKTVLLIDLDLGNRSLDIILGHEDSVVFDIVDVALSRTSAENALLTDEKRKGLFFCPAPYKYKGELTGENLNSAISRLEEASSPDITIIDTSGGADISVELAAACAKRALIVTTYNPTALRAAGKSADFLTELGAEDKRLIINSFDINPKGADEHYSIISMIDRTTVPVIGIVPEDKELSFLAENGLLAGEMKKKARSSKEAFDSIAARLEGERIPLLAKIKKISNRTRKKLLSGGKM